MGELAATKVPAPKPADWFWRAMVKGDEHVMRGLIPFSDR